MSVHSPQVYTGVPRRNPDSSAFYKAAVVLLGLLVGFLGIAALLLWADSRDNGAAATPAAPAVADSHASDHNVALPLESFAGKTGANAQALAAAHKPYDAAIPAIPAGDVVKVRMVMKHKAVDIAPGVKYNVWAFDGKYSAPGPIVHVREGQTVEFTPVIGGEIRHSLDFHAARIAPNVAFTDVAPGESFTFRFQANDPGIFMYHCGTKPVLAHIANGMYGAIIVEPKAGLPKVDNEYVLVGSEWYLDGDGTTKPASLNMEKARAMAPDWTTWNGYANQYVTHPLTADPGDTTRFWVVAAGPTLDTNFHVVGTIFDRAWVNGDMINAPQKGVQTVAVPAGGGGAFDVKIDDAGTYPFVSHAFAHVDLGQVGILKVGHPSGTHTH